MNRIKKWISGLLVFCMVFSVIPVVSFAEEYKEGTIITLEEEIWDLPDLQTTGYEASSFSLGADGKPQLKVTNEVEWIDRLADLPDFATDFYDWLVENSDGDGTDDALIDPTTGTELNESYVYPVMAFLDVPLDFTYTAGASSDEIKQAASDAVSAMLSENMGYASAYITAVFSAFDRDHPEVFWLSGTSQSRSTATYSYTTNDDGTGTITYTQVISFTLQSTSGFDVRAEAYQNVSTIRSAISTRDSAVSSIIADATGNRQAKIQYLNEWLTMNNCYNTTTDLVGISHDCNECISALKGSVGTSGPVCEAYARAFKVLCDAMGIPCVLVDGSSDSKKDHMWNYVQMDDGRWYAVDVTWNDPSVSGVTGAVSGYENEKFLLVGSTTEIDGTAFGDSHLVMNTVTDGGVAFINGPVIADRSYEDIMMETNIYNMFSNIELGPYAMKGATINIAGYEIPLINVEANISLELVEDRIKIIESNDGTIQLLFGFNQDLDAEIGGSNNSTEYWSESYQEVKNLYQNLTGGQVDTTRLWNKFSSLRGKLKPLEASMIVETDTWLAGYAELSIEDGSYKLTEAGMLASFEIGTSLRHYYGPCYVALGLEAGVDGKLYFTEVNNKYMPQISVNPSVTLSAGGGIGTKSTYAQVDAYGTLEAIIATETENPFRAGVDLGVRWGGYILGQEVFSGNKSFASMEIYPNFGDTWETSSLALTPGIDVSDVQQYNNLINEAIPISRSYLTAPIVLNTSGTYPSISFTKENCYPLSEPNLVHFEDESMLLVWIDDSGEKTDQNMCSLMYSYFDGDSWSAPSIIFEKGTMNDMPYVYSDGRYAYIVWQRAQKVFEEDTETEEMLKYFDIYVTIYDSLSGEIEEPICITSTDNDVFEFNPVIVGDSKGFRVAWIENSDNNVYQMSGENKLQMAYFSREGIMLEFKTILITAGILTDVAICGNNVYYSVMESESNNLYCHCSETEMTLIKKGINDFDIAGNTIFYSDTSGLHSFDGKETVTYPEFGMLDSFQICNYEDNYALFITVLKEDFTKVLYYSRLSKQEDSNWTAFEVFSDNGTYIQDYSPTMMSDNTVYVAYNMITMDSDTGTYSAEISVDRCTNKVDIITSYVTFEDEKLSTGSIELLIGIMNQSSTVMDSFIVHIMNPEGVVVYETTVTDDLSGFGSAELNVTYSIPEDYDNEIYTITVLPSDYSDIYEENNVVKTTFECIRKICNIHNYDVPVYVWDEDYSCKVSFTCIYDDDLQMRDCIVTSETLLPTETEDGAIIYTATAEFNGQTYSDTKIVIIPATGYLAGDITGDGKVNNRDAARLMQYLAGWNVQYVEAALDVNGDGKVNNRDAARLMQYLAGWDVELFSTTKGEVLDAGVCGNSVIWILYNSGLLEISGTGAMTDYFEMDDEANGFSAPPWDACQAEITKLVINDGITEIGSHAFRLCTSLTSVTIPESVTIIGGDAFRHCTALSTVTIPKNVTEIGTHAFSWCESLERVEIYADSVSIIDCAFQDCTSLTEVLFTGDAPEIADRMVFYNVSTVIYYPADNETWTGAIMQNYDGEITWVPYTLGENGNMITVETV